MPFFFFFSFETALSMLGAIMTLQSNPARPQRVNAKTAIEDSHRHICLNDMVAMLHGAIFVSHFIVA